MADLLFVEHAAQAADARSASRDWRVIALSPEAMAALDEAGCAYSCPEDYVPTSVIDEAGRALCEQALAFCRSLDLWLTAQSDEVAGSGLEPAQLWHYHFNILAQAVTLRALELRAIFDSERPMRARGFTTTSDTPTSDLSFRDESVYMRLVPIVAGERGVAAEYSAAVSRPRQAAKLRRRPSGMIPARWRQRLKQVYALGTSGSREAVDADAPTALVLNATPDIREVMRAQSPFRFVHWQGVGSPMTIKPMRLRRDLQVVPRPAGAAPAWNASIGQLGLVAPELWSVIESRVRHFVATVVPEMVQSAGMCEAVVDHYRPALALAGILPDHRASAAAARMRHLGVPLVLYQHGGSYGYFDLPVHYYNDLRIADWFLTYGQGVARELEHRHGRRQPCAKMIDVGSAALSEAQRKANTPASARESRPVVLYVATCLMGSRFYAPHYRSCRYYRLLTRVAEALGGVTGIRAVLKIHSRADNTYNPLAQRLKAGDSRVEVVTDGPLEPWLHASDLIVVDLPGTPLLDALAAEKPVLASCDPEVFKLTPETEQALRRDVQLETNEDRFIARLRNVHDELRLARKASSGSSGFLQDYGTDRRRNEPGSSRSGVDRSRESRRERRGAGSLMKPQVLAVIPVSGKDAEFRTGIPRLAGRSILDYTFDAVRGSRAIGRAIVSTDDRRIARASRAAGIEVPFLRSARMRRAHLSQILKDAVEFLEARDPDYRPEWIVRLQVTFPFREPGLIDRAIKTVLTKKLDSAFVALPEFDTFWNIGRDDAPERITTDTRVPRQVRTPIYRELGGLFSMVHRSVLAEERIYGHRLGIIPVRSPLSSVDLHATRGFELATAVAPVVAERGKRRSKQVMP